MSCHLITCQLSGADTTKSGWYNDSIVCRMLWTTVDDHGLAVSVNYAYLITVAGVCTMDPAIIWLLILLGNSISDLPYRCPILRDIFLNMSLHVKYFSQSQEAALYEFFIHCNEAKMNVGCITCRGNTGTHPDPRVWGLSNQNHCLKS